MTGVVVLGSVFLFAMPYTALAHVDWIEVVLPGRLQSDGRISAAINDNGEIVATSSVPGGRGTSGLWSTWIGMPGDLVSETGIWTIRPTFIDNTGRTLVQDTSHGPLLWFDGAELGPIEEDRVDVVGVDGVPISFLSDSIRTGPDVLFEDGQPATGFEQFEDIRIGRYNRSQAAVDRGLLAFVGRISGPGVDADSNEAFWAGRAGALHLVTFEGTQLPDLGDGAGKVVKQFLINGVGSVVLITAGSANSSSPLTVWSWKQGQLSRIVSYDEPAPPAFGEDAHYWGFKLLAFNDRDELAMSVTTSDRDGEVVGTPGHLRALAVEGSPVPGISEGAVFVSQGSGTVFREFGMNNAGQVVFMAGYENSSGQGGTAIFAGRPGALELVVKAGQQVELASGEVRTVSAEEWIWNGARGVNHGAHRTFNDRGELLIPLLFDAEFGEMPQESRLFLATISSPVGGGSDGGQGTASDADGQTEPPIGGGPNGGVADTGQTDGQSKPSDSGSGICGLGAGAMMPFTMLGWSLMRRRRSTWSRR